MVRRGRVITRYGAACAIDTTYGTDGTATLPVPLATDSIVARDTNALAGDGTALTPKAYDYTNGLTFARLDPDGQPGAPVTQGHFEAHETFNFMIGRDDASFWIGGSGSTMSGKLGTNYSICRTAIGVDGSPRSGSCDSAAQYSSSTPDTMPIVLMSITAQGLDAAGIGHIGGTLSGPIVLDGIPITHEGGVGSVRSIVGLRDGRVVAVGYVGQTAFATCVQR